ncbi:DIS3-like exonuclease 2 isoform X2 [Varroa destructor]|uniref:RNB domain-containing protein n=1 Tax=Varroa destructor TaxID=109461 RepID=A0A7M7M9Y5_VARDE|nr:DIS3-like exonuclease 2 isoform X2 [Varroa destructor]
MEDAAAAEQLGGLPDIGNLGIAEKDQFQETNNKKRQKKRKKKSKKADDPTIEVDRGPSTFQTNAHSEAEDSSATKFLTPSVKTDICSDEVLDRPSTFQEEAKPEGKDVPEYALEKAEASTNSISSAPLQKTDALASASSSNQLNANAKCEAFPVQKERSPLEYTSAVPNEIVKKSSTSQAVRKRELKQKRKSSKNGNIPINVDEHESTTFQGNVKTKIEGPNKPNPGFPQEESQKSLLPETIEDNDRHQTQESSQQSARQSLQQPDLLSHPLFSGDFRLCALESFLTPEAVQAKKLDGTCIEGTIRINRRNSEEAFVRMPDDAEGGKCQWDIRLEGLDGRGRALNGDQVAVELLPREKWKIQVKSIQQWEADNKISLFDFVRNSDTAPEDVTTRNESKDGVSVKSVSEAVGGGAVACAVVDNPAVNETRSCEIEYPLELIFEHPEWGRFVQRTGRVIGIVSETGPRVSCGLLRTMKNEFWHQIDQQKPAQHYQHGNRQRPKAALFVPQDKRFPHLWIPAGQCPPNFFERPLDYSKTLYCARLVQWPGLPDPKGHWELPQGELLKLIGKTGDVEAETMAILTSQAIDFEEYTEDILSDLSVPVRPDWTIPTKEFESRRDFRRELVVSIDPSTARDLDDALSVKQIADNLYEVGVHIADVSYFIPSGCKVDKKAESRATSVYLVQRVIPMLPRILCDQLCSLTAGTDRLTFSVVWKMNSQGQVLDEWFGRSIVNSSCQLSYEHAQQMIDFPNHKWRPEELPNIYGCWTVSDINKSINILNGMATKMRERRVAKGCLRLDQIRLEFALANDGTTPQGFSIYEHTESHKLIEEFMLQANMAVAHQLVKYFPEMAFLRNHPPPDWRRLETIVRSFKFEDLIMNGRTSGDLQKSLFDVVDSSNRIKVVDSISSCLRRNDRSARDALLGALCNVLSKPFRPASYFVAGSMPNTDHYRHFALAVPLYTHFTSPIRRYADLVVHRLLAASLDLAKCPYKEMATLQRVANHCNERKYAAKTAQDLSNELFVWTFISKLPGRQMKDDFLVIAALDKAVDVMSLSTGLVLRAYVDKQGVLTTRFSNDPDCLIMVFDSDRGPDCEETLKLTLLTPVHGMVTASQYLGKYLVIFDAPLNAIRRPVSQ